MSEGPDEIVSVVPPPEIVENNLLEMIDVGDSVIEKITESVGKTVILPVNAPSVMDVIVVDWIETLPNSFFGVVNWIDVEFAFGDEMTSVYWVL